MSKFWWNIFVGATFARFIYLGCLLPLGLCESILDKLPLLVSNSVYVIALAILKFWKKEELSVYFIIVETLFNGIEMMSFPEAIYNEDKNIKLASVLAIDL